MDLETYRLKRFYAWRQRVNKHIPVLASRIFELRNRFYVGCGFHYGLEGELGSVIRQLNDFDNHYDLCKQIVLEIYVEQLFSRVKKAEKSAKQLTIERKSGILKS